MNNLKLVTTMNNAPEIATIATSAVLIDLRVSTWTGRKRDKKSTADVVHNNNAGSAKAASVVKNLMTDDKDLDAIRAHAQDTRLKLISSTLAWGDKGTRLLPSARIFAVASDLDTCTEQYEKLVNKFLTEYTLKVSAAAFKLGALFRREEFPPADVIARKFTMSYAMTPVPTSGDFRVDVQNDVGAFLQQQFKTAADARVAEALREPWERAFQVLQAAKERIEAAMTYEASEGEDGKKTRAPRIFQSMFDNAVELAETLDTLNITNDPQLADCAAKMRRLFGSVDAKSFRESPDHQAAVRKQVDDLMNTFDFSGFAEE
jgi:hypothetical protein